MTSRSLDNLVRIGRLTKETPRADELKGLLTSALARLADAKRPELSFASRFDLAYGAAHALALYVLRQAGYRSDVRYVVFQALPHTAGLETVYWRVLAKAHENRNVAEYEGYLERDERLLAETLDAASCLLAIIDKRREPQAD